MSGLETGLRLGVGIVLILANAFFVMTEFALTRLRQLDREDLGGGGSPWVGHALCILLSRRAGVVGTMRQTRCSS